jgi:hypothetical protein
VPTPWGRPLFRRSDSEVRAYDGAGVRVDVMESRCVYRGEDISGTFRVGQMWSMSGGRWRLVALQYTSLSRT